jgi:hypothetical protein
MKMNGILHFKQKLNNNIQIARHVRFEVFTAVTMKRLNYCRRPDG